MIGTTSPEAFRVPVTREPSVNERPNISEITRGPSAIEGLAALGETVHRVATASYERVMDKIGRQRTREVVAFGKTEPDKLNMALVEAADAGVTEALAAEAEMNEQVGILEQRTDGRRAIIAELEDAVVEA
jgi:hypothetical protein